MKAILHITDKMNNVYEPTLDFYVKPCIGEHITISTFNRLIIADIEYNYDGTLDDIKAIGITNKDDLSTCMTVYAKEV